MKTTSFLRSVLVLALAASPAAAEDYARNGLYVGLSGVRAFSDFDASAKTRVRSFIVSTPLDGGDAWGVEARVGYRFHPHAAAELQLQYYDQFGLSFRGAEVAKFDGGSATVNAKYYPFTGRVQPYVLGGVGTAVVRLREVFGTSTSVTEARFAGRIGGGVDVYLTEAVALHGEVSYLLPTGSLSDFREIPLAFGAQYRF